MPCHFRLAYHIFTFPFLLALLSSLGHKILLSVLRIMILQDLWRSRRGLKDVEGFDHSVVNDTLGACDLPPSINAVIQKRVIKKTLPMKSRSMGG